MDAKELQSFFEQSGKSKSGLAEALRIPRSAVTSLLKGDRRFIAHEVPLILRYFGADESVPVKGFVGGGGQVELYDLDVHALAKVKGPAEASKDTVALEVRGDSLGPLHGWLLFFDEPGRKPGKALLDALCVVGLSDERVLVRTLQASRLKARYHLISSNGSPPLLDTPVEWAAKVIGMRPK